VNVLSVYVCYATLERGVVMCSVASVCVCVCLPVLFGLLTVERLGIGASFLVSSYIFRMSRSRSYIKVIGSSSRSRAKTSNERK